MESEVEVDIPCDPTQIDHTGLPWTFLDEAAHPDRIVEGAIYEGANQIQRIVIAKKLFS